jgi:hypothetical protein
MSLPGHNSTREVLFMKKPKQKIDYREHEEPPAEQFPDISDVASASECTGLMYKAPRDQEEWDNYQELSSMAIPRKKSPEK